ncbi:amino acid hydroxylase [Chloroflexus sp.]|uniref:amino acid hydroxylase n=1 Tax=Chloroflexus sp. TaxID=1904827 RepID=UPI002ACD5C4D|nr:amino acid hydroxylase [Chloroflexus sp.]
MSTLAPPALPAYTEEDHAVWATLCARQVPRLERYACRLFRAGFRQLNLDLTRLPDPAQVSERLVGFTGWTLCDAQNEYLNPTEWFEHIAERRFPVTNYIRRMDELDFTPMPDLFHEYIGHLAFFTDRRFAEIAQAFGPLYFAGDERQRLEIARLWWYSIEFGLIRENGELRAFGAGLLSSIGELDHAFAPDTPREPFDIRRVANTPGAAYSMHETYFILEDLEHVAAILRAYAAMEGLPPVAV